jgi:hypothetical protein
LLAAFSGLLVVNPKSPQKSCAAGAFDKRIKAEADERRTAGDNSGAEGN